MVLTNPITGVTIDALTVEDVYGLAYKVIDSIIDGADISFEFPELHRTISEWGAIVERGRIPASESVAVNPNTTSKMAPAYPTVKTLYYQDWTEKVYPADVRKIDASKVLSGEMDFNAFVAKIVNANVEGYADETNQAVKKAMLAEYDALDTTPSAIKLAAADGAVQTGDDSVLGAIGQYEVLQAPTYADVYKEVQKVAKNMQYANGIYSDDFRAGARMDDLVIFAPYEFMIDSGVDYLSKLYNMSEAKKLPTIHETDGLRLIDTAGDAHNVILVCDKRFISHVERWRDTVSGYDRDRKSEYHDLHVEDMVAINTLYKAYAIVFPDATEEPTELVNT